VSDYGTDFYQWTRQQAALLEDKSWDPLDIEHLIEEVRSLGHGQAHAVESHLRTLLTHLLQWRDQPVRRKPRWRQSIGNARDEIDDRRRRNPSLRGKVPDYLARQYPKARRRAVRETGLPPATFPASGPWAVERVLDEDCWPEGG
jgi:hypothetical protein